MKRTILLLILVGAILSTSTVFATDRHVPSEYATIQAAINAAVNGDRVIIAQGTYTGADNRELDFGGRAISVQSTDPNNWDVVAGTIIDCQYGGRGFHFHSGETTSSVLAGLTITNGYADFGGGIFCTGSSPTIRNCKLTDNMADYGGGMGNQNCSPAVAECMFVGNSVFYYGGGMYNSGCTLAVSNCIFTGNSADWGGGMENANCSGAIVNCTFTGNSADMGGGIDNISSSGLTVSNCILWGDTAGTGPEIYGTVSVSYSDVQGGTTGTGNINADPCFADAVGGDYHLLEGSPCIDAGTNGPAGGLPATDIEGTRRPLDGNADGTAVADMGSYEFAFASYAWAKSVRESAREIPVVYEVDVVVLGGSSAGVAAAIGAAEEGATVFLAAPRPYLGEDLCGTYRIWVEPNEVPNSGLAYKLFNGQLSGIRLSCYETDIPSDSLHPDTEPPSLLCDGWWESVFTDSVQYNEDVNIVFDLGREHNIERVHIITYQAPNNYEVNDVTVSVSNNGEQWQQILEINNGDVGGTFVDPPLRLSGNATGEGRYVKFFVRKSATAGRLLLGEIQVEGTVVSAPSNPNLPSPPTLMHLKSVLDKELLSGGVDFLFGCYPTDVLRDAEGNLAGIAMCNRSGRQAVVAKTIIDATPRATVARIAGVDFQPYPAGPQTFKRIVIGGLMQSGEGIQAEMIPSPIPKGCSFYDAIEYTLTIAMPDGSFTSFAEAEQVARDLTFEPNQVDESEMLFQVPPDTMNGQTSLAGPWPGSQNVDLGVFRPANEDRLYVLGGCADISREAAEEMLRPPVFIDVGARIGQRAAVDANTLPEPQSVRLSSTSDPNAISGDVREVLRGIRPTQMCLSTVRAEERSLPVLGEYDVVVVGGGTAGAPAGIGAVRHGANTLVVEYQYGLGGVGTLGLIGSYCYGYSGGFNEEVDQGVANIGGVGVSSSWKPEWKKEWYRRELRQAGADIWFGVLGCGVFVQNNRVKGIVVATPQGRGVVLAKTVIDSTGNSDIAAAGGAECITIGSSHIAVQGAGLPPHELGATYTNTDWTFIDDSDVVDSWRALVVAKDRWPRAYDLGKLIDTRERRRIVGDYILSPLDMLNQRTFPDTIAMSDGGLYDSHSILSHPYFTIGNWYGGITYIPYRCLLPKGLDGILVAGLGLSAHGDTMGFIRMQRDIQNVGYAAGVAASIAAESDIDVRNIDISELRQHLVTVGNITPDVLTHTDSYPIASADIEAAVQTLVDANYSGLSILLAQPDESVPLLKNAYNTATEPNSRLRCAHVLGLLNDATGVQTLVDKVNSYTEFDTAHISKWFPNITWLDSYIIALGYTRDSQALQPLLDKLALLPGQWRFSHHRSVALALEQLGDPAAAEPLADLLCVDWIRGYTFTDINDALSANPWLRKYNYSVRELILARVLYRCGDWEGIGESILREYGMDLRGHLARHAQAVLREKSADMNDDCKVDFGDYSILAFEWLLLGDDLKADLHKDGTIDIRDLAVLAEVWLEEQPWPPPLQ